MATESGRTGSPLARILFDEAYRFDFFQAVRLLERIYSERSPVGRDAEPAREVVRFRTRASLSFPASEVHQITADKTSKEARADMVVAFMGLTGPLGVLPHYYTEMLVDRKRDKDTALWEFLDMFNHRMISFFYRAWEKYRFPIEYERGGDRFTDCLFGLIGMGTRGLRERMSIRDEGLLYYSGLIAQQPHSASAIEAILGDYLNVPVRVEQFYGQWLKLDEGSMSRLGRANNCLGVTTITGARVWDDQSKFRLRFGPLTYKQFTALLPGGSAFRQVVDFTRLLAGMALDFDLRLTLKAEEVPNCVVTTRAKRRPMLGWTTWLKTREFTEDDSQMVLAVDN